MVDYFTSDLHLNHVFTSKHRPEFENVSQMNEAIFKAFEPVRKGDRVYILGDVGWTRSTIESLFKYITYEKKAIVYWAEGNHDHDLFKKIEMKNLHKAQSFFVRGYDKYKPIFVSHYPTLIYEKSCYGAYMLHGHGHRTTTDVPMLENIVLGKRLNVNIELHNYKLWTRDEVEEYMKNRPENLDAYLTCGEDWQKDIATELTKDIGAVIHHMYSMMGNLKLD